MLGALQTGAQLAVAAGDPADPESGQSQGLGGHVQGQCALGEVGGLGQDAGRVVFEAPVDLVAEQVDVPLVAQPGERGEVGRVDDLSGRVVGEVHRDDPGVGPYRRRDLVEVQGPVPVRVEGHPGDLAQRHRHGLGGLVVRGHHHRVVARSEEDVHGQVEGFLGTGETDDVVGTGALVHLRDHFTQCRVAERLGVTQGQVLEGVPVLVIGQREELAERHGLHVGGGQVMAGGELPPREVRLQAEIGQPGHGDQSFVLGALSSASRP